MYSIELWDFDEDVIENLTDADVQEAVTKGIVERWAKKNPIFWVSWLIASIGKSTTFFSIFDCLLFSRSGSKE